MNFAKILLVPVVMLALAPAWGEPLPITGSVPDLLLEVGLTGALFSYEEPSRDGPTLLMDLARYGDRWERVWGMARNFNLGIHNGRVVSAKVTDQMIECELALSISGDAWIPGGRATYTVKMARAADGKLEGTFEGKFRDKVVKGRAFGQVRPVPKLTPGYVPVQMAEHPQVLFRKSDLPMLRDRAKTELGQVALAAMGGPQEDGDAIGMGIKYQLTGDKKFAEQARQSTVKHMANESGGALAVGRAWGPRFEQVALAYDLCYDARPFGLGRRWRHIFG